MRKLLFTLTLLSFHTFCSYATGDSLRYLTAKDTVFIKLDDFGNKLFGHTLVKGQTIFSLARHYGLKVESLYSYNPSLTQDGNFEMGQEVFIPIPDSAIVKEKMVAYPTWKFAPVVYEVKHGDTFYRIAQHFFKMPLDTLKTRNKLTHTAMHSGQKLLIGWLPLSGIEDSLQLANSNPMGAKMQQLQLKFDAEKNVKKEYFQNGAAYWQREKKMGTDFYALHRTAPVGSVIQVSNPMKKKTVFAKVIAPIPDRAYGDDIIVVLSPSVAKLLGAKDPKFFVEVRYVK